MLESDVTATIENATFTGNSGLQGGAILIANGSEVTIEGCTFSGNSATVSGGAIENESKTEGNVTIKNCTFTGNTAPTGGAINMAAGSYIELEDCTFTNNDISVADSEAEVHISGKMVATINNVDKSVLYVDGALEDGSDVTVEWAGSIPDNSVGIVFESDAIMNASQPYIRLGDTVFATYSLVYVKATDTEKASGKLVLPYEVDTYDKLTTALTDIASADGQVGVIRLTGEDIAVTSQIQIPADCNVTIEDDGNAVRKIVRGVKNKDMILMGAGSTLTLRSTGTLDNCKLILDGNKDNYTAGSSKATTMIRMQSSVTATVNIYSGVKLQNNDQGKGGGGIVIESSTGTVCISGAWFDGIDAVGTGGAIHLKGNCDINNSKFTNCSSDGAGGAIYIYTGVKCNIKDTKFENCEAGTKGAAIYNLGTLTLVGTTDNATISGCSCPDNNSAIFLNDGTVSGSGYIFVPKDDDNVLIYRNKGTDNYTYSN